MATEYRTIVRKGEFSFPTTFLTHSCGNKLGYVMAVADNFEKHLALLCKVGFYPQNETNLVWGQFEIDPMKNVNNLPTYEMGKNLLLTDGYIVVREVMGNGGWTLEINDLTETLCGLLNQLPTYLKAFIDGDNFLVTRFFFLYGNELMQKAIFGKVKY